MIDKSNSKKNTKKRIKSEIVDSPRIPGAFFLQKYEIFIMLLGAGIIFVLIFFVFLKPSNNSNILKTENNTESVTVEDFQKQIDRLADMVEKSGLKENGKIGPKQKSSNISYADHEKRIERIEASLSQKYETLASRINRLEKSIDQLSRKNDSNKKTSSAKVVKPSLVKTSKKSETKKAVTKKKESIFHTVIKGDTLYGLSLQYGTSVSELEKMNNLSKNAKIYPGNNLLVK